MWLPSARLPPGGPLACQDSILNSYRTAYGGRIHIRTPKDKVTERVQKLRPPYLQAPDRTCPGYQRGPLQRLPPTT